MRPNFRGEAVGIGFVDLVVADIGKRGDICTARLKSRSGTKPSQTPAALGASASGAGIPLVEVADHRNALGVGRPDREVHAAAAVLFAEVRAEFVVGALVRALCEQIEIEFGLT